MGISQLPNKMRGLEFALLLFSLLLTSGTCKSITFNMTNIPADVRNYKGLASILIRTGDENGESCDLKDASTLGFRMYSNGGDCGVTNLNASPGNSLQTVLLYLLMMSWRSVRILFSKVVLLALNLHSTTITATRIGGVLIL